MSLPAGKPSEDELSSLYGQLVARLRARAVFVMDAQRRVLSWNPGVESLFGYTEREFIGMSADALFTPEDRAAGAPEREAREAVERGDAADIRWHLRKDGDRIFIDGHMVALRAVDGTVVALAKVMRDATERRLNEERLQKLTEGLNLAPILIRRLDDTVEFWSVGCERMYGFTPDEATGRNAHALLQTRFPAPLPTIVEELRATRRWSGELQQRRRDGSEIIVMSESVLHGCAEQEPLAIIEACTNITALRQAAAENERLVTQLSARAGELEAILASMPDALYIGNEAGIRVVNRAGLEQLGFGSPEELRTGIDELASRIRTRDPRTGEVISAADQPFARALRGETVARDVAITHVATGEEAVVRCSAAPVYQDGRIVGAIAINTDITNEVRSQAEREQLLAALQRSNEQLAQFAHTVSHDLQAPLRMIRSYTELLGRRYRGKLDPSADEFIETVLEGALHMDQLIQAMLHYAEVGKEKPDRTTVDVRSVIDAVRTILGPAIEESEAQIECGPMPFVEADRIHLQQLFQNLIGNAIKYRRPGTRPLIEISAREEARQWSFSVADNGIGVPPADAERIFEPLTRLHGRNIPGTGMGLAVCRNIVEHHGGRIWVAPSRHGGSAFVFTICKK